MNLLELEKTERICAKVCITISFTSIFKIVVGSSSEQTTPFHNGKICFGCVYILVQERGDLKTQNFLTN